MRKCYHTSVSKLSARELISMIKSVIKETVAKDITLIKNDIIIIKSELTKVEKLESEVNDLRETINIQQNTIEQQQTFLEYLANKDRQNNLIVTGVTETDQDEAVIKAIFETIVPDADVSPEGNYVMQRLGNPETARVPRPVHVRFHNQSLEKKRMIVKNSKKLKDNERYKKVYIKKDTHPVFRKEHNRLSKLAWEEKQKPTNQGCNIKYDRKKRIVTKDDIIIDRFSINF